MVFRFYPSHAGYDSSVTIKEIYSDDIKEFEKIAKSIPKTIKTFVKEAKISANAAQINVIQRLFLGICLADSFKFRKGDIVLTLKIAQFARSKFESDENCPNDGFSFFETVRETKQTPTMETLVGVLFCDSICTNDNHENAQCDQESVEKHIPKKRVAFRSIVPTATGHDRLFRTNSLAANHMAIDIISAKKILFDSCLEQIKSALRETFRTNSFEEAFMKKCGFESLEALTVDISFTESDLQYFLEAESHKVLKASIVCYCSNETKSATATGYFRANSKWVSLTSENISTLVSKELATCWNIGNLKRHLVSHRKKFEASCKFPL